MTREKYIAVTPIVWTQVIKVDDRDNDPMSYWQSGHGWWGLIGDWPSIMRVVSNAMFTVYIGTSGMGGTPNVVLTVWCLVIFSTLTRSRLTCVNLWLNAEPNVWTEKEPPHRRKNFREGHMNNFGVKSLTDVQCLWQFQYQCNFTTAVQILRMIFLKTDSIHESDFLFVCLCLEWTISFAHFLSPCRGLVICVTRPLLGSRWVFQATFTDR